MAETAKAPGDDAGRVATSRDVLNELRWRHDALAEVQVWYRHRGAPGDRRVVTGDRIRALHRSFLEIDGRWGGTLIPYHRVLRIERAGRARWTRPPSYGEGRSV